jgi:hypothetical protein
VEGLAQRTIGSDSTAAISSLITSRSRPRLTDEKFSAAADKLAKETSARAASYRSMSSPVASSNDINTCGRIGMDRAQDEVLTRHDSDGSIRHSAQNLDLTREERQAPISRQQVTNITKIFGTKMKFAGVNENGNMPLDQTISAYRSICEAIVAPDEDARHAMFTIFSDAALARLCEHDTERYSVTKVLAGLRGIFYDVATVEQLEIKSTKYS